MTNREVVTTPELKNGDIVLTHGMRVAVSNRTEHKYGNDPVVIHFEGRVLNPQEVTEFGLVSVGMRTNPNKQDFAAGEYWAIQGNLYARWTREV